nr:response regulator [Solirubrobacterales bacterium]
VMKVLSVDDNRMNQVLVVGTLNKLGHEVEIVNSGAAAVAACTAGRFDVILMDIMMPGMDGFEATAQIRAIEAAEGRRTPIIGLSARDMDGDRGIAISAGLDEYLTKPLRVNELQLALRRWSTGTAEDHDRDEQ